jgi:hypothetical protein
VGASIVRGLAADALNFERAASREKEKKQTRPPKKKMPRLTRLKPLKASVFHPNPKITANKNQKNSESLGPRRRHTELHPDFGKNVQVCNVPPVGGRNKEKK